MQAKPSVADRPCEGREVLDPWGRGVERGLGSGASESPLERCSALHVQGKSSKHTRSQQLTQLCLCHHQQLSLGHHTCLQP